jgi:cyclopropane fatty-acyl-phospholipid synthase-like methyltransferase
MDQHRAGALKDVVYWERWFASAETDPWRYETSEAELAKYRRTLEVCAPTPGTVALEIGCATGVFTAMLASRCASVLGVDISETAIRRGYRRVSGFTNVRFERRTVPAEFPDGSFDLIVCSDLLYYFTEHDVRAVARKIEERTSATGRVVIVNHERPITIHPTRVFEIVADELRSFARSHDEVLGRHRIVRFDRTE